MELNPFAWEFHEDPYPTYRWLREHRPLYRNAALDFWALSRFPDVVHASQDWSTYSSAEGTTLERMDPAMFEAMPMMIFLDPPRHDRLRRLVSQTFTPRRIAALEPSVRATTIRLLEPLLRDGGGDLVSRLAGPLPMEMIFTLLGVPDEDRATLRGWMDLSLERDRDDPAIPPRALGAMAELVQYWMTLLERLRSSPNAGLISALLETEVGDEGGTASRLGDGEIIGFCSLLGAAGNETVTRLLGNAAVLLSRHPDQWRWLREDPARIPGAVEEVLRFWPPSQYQGRVTTREVAWHGDTVPAGARLLLLTGSACRDERGFEDPDRFDVSRSIPLALGFGHGIHFCLGAALARLESRVVLEEMARRVERLRVDEAGLRRVHMSNVHGFEHVPVALG